MKSLVINADDFGLAKGINDAVIDTFLNGSVTSTTLMVNTPASRDAIDKALEYPELGVGLHFNLTLGRPLTDGKRVRTLVDGSGDFYSRSALARRFALRQVNPVELELELSAQFEAMRHCSLVPTHIDSHQHIHAFPLCFDAVAALCKRQRLPIRMPWILDIPQAKVPLGRRIKQSLLKRMLARNAARWEHELNWNSGLGSLFDLGTLTDTLQRNHYNSVLENAPNGVFELMVHPARNASELNGLTAIGDFSEREWRFLMTAELPELIRNLGFNTGTYRTLLHA